MKKFFKIGCLGFIALFVLLVILGAIFGEGSGNVKNTQNKEEMKISKVINKSPEQTTKIVEVLKEIGIEKIESIESDELLDNAHIEGEKGYRISANGINNIILYTIDDGSVHMVRWADNDLYKDGKIVSKLNDYLLSNKEKSDLQIKSQKAIQGLLKAPATADFPNITQWAFAKKEGIVTVQSYVDAENGFGANIRSEFQLVIDNSTVTSLIFDGQEYIK